MPIYFFCNIFKFLNTLNQMTDKKNRSMTRISFLLFQTHTSEKGDSRLFSLK